MSKHYIDRICNMFDNYVNTVEPQFYLLHPINISLLQKLNDMILIETNPSIEKEDELSPYEWIEIYNGIETYLKIRGYIIDEVNLDNSTLQIEFRKKNMGDY